jgi:hypothetical protein
MTFRLEVRMNQIYYIVIIIYQWQQPPFVEVRAGMRDTTADNVADSYRSWSNFHEGMLII